MTNHTATPSARRAASLQPGDQVVDDAGDTLTRGTRHAPLIGTGAARVRRTRPRGASSRAAPYAKRASSLVSWLVKPSSCIRVNSSLCIASSVTDMRTVSPWVANATTISLS